MLKRDCESPTSKVITKLTEEINTENDPTVRRIILEFCNKLKQDPQNAIRKVSSELENVEENNNNSFSIWNFFSVKEKPSVQNYVETIRAYIIEDDNFRN